MANKQESQDIKTSGGVWTTGRRPSARARGGIWAVRALQWLCIAVFWAMPMFCLGGHAPIRFKVGQWNIGHFSHGEKHFPSGAFTNAEPWNAVLDEMDVDVLGLCEYHYTMGDGRDTIGYLGGKYADFHVGDQLTYMWNATWVKTNAHFVHVRTEQHDYASCIQHAYWLDSVYEVAGQEVHFVETHLDWQGVDERPSQMAELIRFYADDEHVVLCGDWNNKRGPDEWMLFATNGYVMANPCTSLEAIQTCQSNDGSGTSALDNILVKGFEISDVRTAGDDYALSDHRAIYATLKMLGPSLPECIQMDGVGELPTRWLETFGLLDDVETEEALEARWEASAANGRPNYECYVTGVSPVDDQEEFWVSLAMADGTPVVSWTPDWSQTPCPMDGLCRRYEVEGCEDLEAGAWGPTNGMSRFFRVRVQLPQE